MSRNRFSLPHRRGVHSHINPKGSVYESLKRLSDSQVLTVARSSNFEASSSSARFWETTSGTSRTCSWVSWAWPLPRSAGGHASSGASSSPLVARSCWNARPRGRPEAGDQATDGSLLRGPQACLWAGQDASENPRGVAGEADRGLDDRPRLRLLHHLAPRATIGLHQGCCEPEALATLI